VAHSTVLRSCFLAVVLVSTLSLGACTTDDHKLPTLSDTDAPTVTSLEATAKTYHDCMTDAGIQMEFTQNPDGELAMVTVAYGHIYLQRDKDGTTITGGTADNHPTQQMTDDLLSKLSPGPGLIVDGIDYSAAWLQCLDTSGYNEQAALGSAGQMDPVQTELQVRGNNKWTACARENGWPDIKDSVMPTGTDWSGWPMILLPSTITEDQLRQLLDACPNFDAEQTKKMTDWWQENPNSTGYPDDYLPDPVFTFSETADTDEATRDHINRLYTILSEKMNEYYQAPTPR